MAWTTWVCTSGGRSGALDARSSLRAAIICSIVSIFVSGAPVSSPRASCSIARPCSARAAELTLSTRVAVLHGSGERAQCPQPRLGSGDADIVRASQLQHAVEHVDCHVHLSRPTLVRTR